MKTKIILCCLASVLTAASADDVGQSQNSGQPQVITLNDGTKLTFLGLTTGTMQMAPGFETLPTANRLYTPDRPAMAWIKVEQNRDHNWTGALELLVSDKARTACVSLEKSTSSNVRRGVDIQGFILHTFPRWDKEFLARPRLYRGEISSEEFVITNPAPVPMTNWTPETLPVTKSDGDIEVTLNQLIADAPLEPYRRQKSISQDDPQNKCVRIAFDLKQKGQSATNWYPWLVDVSDAVGNHVRTSMQYQDNELIRQHTRPGYALHYGTNDEYKGYYFMPGLWPDEPAWKVRLEFTRQSGFAADEIVTFTNLSVKLGTQQDHDDQWEWDASKTNIVPVAEAMVNGVHMKMLPPLLYPPEIMPGEKHLGVSIYADSDLTRQGMRLKVLQATDGQGHEIWSPFSPAWAGHFEIDLPNPSDVKTLNLKLALHKSRYVEFTVKPTKP